MTAVLLTLTAMIAYSFGCVSSVNLTSNLYFHCDIRKNYPRNNEGITRFMRKFGLKGAVVLMGTEILRILIPLLIGGLLISIKGHADVGYAFAMFCVVLGTVFPVIYEFKGETSFVAVAVSVLFIDMGVAFAMLVTFGVVYYFTRYISLSSLAAVIMMCFVAVMTVNTDLVRYLVFLTAIIVVIENRSNIKMLIKGKASKFTYKKDLSYMFDEDEF